MMRLFSWLRRSPSGAGQFRIVRRIGGYEPQMSYTAGMVKGLFWFPLNAEGYWLDPDAFTSGKVSRHIVMSKEAAKQSVLRARAIEGKHIAAAKPRAHQ